MRKNFPTQGDDREADRLGRLWDSTRPAEPTAAAWNTLWGRLSERLDRSEPQPSTVFKLPARRRYVVASLVVAQAAAILAVVVLWGARQQPAESVIVKTIDIEPGQVVLIHLEGNGLRVVEPALETGFSPLDENLVLFNDAEAMAGMRETVAEMQHDVQLAPPPG